MSRLSRYLKKEKQLPTAITQQPLPPDASLSKLSQDTPRFYKSIHELPLTNFEDCLINNNVAALIISGFPEPSELQGAWENILQEYTEAMGNTEYVMYMNKLREIEILKLNYQMIGILIAALRKNDSEYFKGELRAMLRVNFKFDTSNLETYLAELDKCERRMGGLKLNLDLRLMEFEEIKKRFDADGNKSKQKIDKNYFTTMLIILSKHNGYKITKDITTAEYCIYFKNCSNEIELANKNVSKYQR